MFMSYALLVLAALFALAVLAKVGQNIEKRRKVGNVREVSPAPPSAAKDNALALRRCCSRLF